MKRAPSLDSAFSCAIRRAHRRCSPRLAPPTSRRGASTTPSRCSRAGRARPRRRGRLRPGPRAARRGPRGTRPGRDLRWAALLSAGRRDARPEHTDRPPVRGAGHRRGARGWAAAFEDLRRILKMDSEHVAWLPKLAEGALADQDARAAWPG